MANTEQGRSRWQQAADKDAAEKHFLEVIKERREKRVRMKRIKKFVIATLKFIFSTGGLLIINFAYLYGGAYLFMHLEQLNEIEACKSARSDYYVSENATLILLMDMAQRLNGMGVLTDSDKVAIKSEFLTNIEDFASAVISTGYSVDNDCDTIGKENGTKSKWALSDSFLFAVTISTTIGYGVIAPKTDWGKIVCMVYAVLGIPLFMLCLANVGELMAAVFKITYSTVCCFGCCRKKQVKELTQEEQEKQEETLKKEALVWRTDESGRPIPPDEQELEEYDEEEEEEEEEDVLTVPLTISLLIMIAFIMAGAVIFHILESEWTLLDAAYFSFITFTTIGFGDIVPGTNIKDGKGTLKTVIVVVFIVLGMSALSMCLQMLTNEFTAKFEYLKDKIAAWKEKKLAEQEEDPEGIQAISDPEKH